MEEKLTLTDLIRIITHLQDAVSEDANRPALLVDSVVLYCTRCQRNFCIWDRSMMNQMIHHLADCGKG